MDCWPTAWRRQPWATSGSSRSEPPRPSKSVGQVARDHRPAINGNLPTATPSVQFGSGVLSSVPAPSPSTQRGIPYAPKPDCCRSCRCDARWPTPVYRLYRPIHLTSQSGHDSVGAPAGEHSELHVKTALAPAGPSATPLPRTGWTVSQMGESAVLRSMPARMARTGEPQSQREPGPTTRWKRRRDSPWWRHVSCD